MKALHCSTIDGGCNAVKSFNLDGSLTSCDCGKVHGWWLDPVVGTCAVYTEPEDRSLAHIVVLHNGFLNDGPNMIPKSYYDPLTQHPMPYPAQQGDTFWRQLHTQSGVAPRAPETVRVFDASARDCWAVIVEPGSTADSSWASESDYKTKKRQPALAR